MSLTGLPGTAPVPSASAPPASAHASANTQHVFVSNEIFVSFVVQLSFSLASPDRVEGKLGGSRCRIQDQGFRIQDSANQSCFHSLNLGGLGG
jgi:hypothetical protein